jgi:predicted dehydrogenase
LPHPDGGFDHILTTYHYGDDRLIVAEGAWEYAPGRPFAMTFDIHFERGTLTLAGDGSLVWHPEAGGAEVVPLPPETGYDLELSHFLECIENGAASPVISPESAAESVELIDAEIRSARTRGRVTL